MLVGNPGSGIKASDTAVIAGVEYLQSKGFSVVEVSLKDILTRENFNRELATHSPDTVVAVGGDGTVNLLAGYLKDTDKRLGVIPAGTFNHFARHIGIGTDIPAAFETLINGETISIDTASVNGHAFVNFSSVGFYTRLITRRVFYQKRAWKKWTAFMVAFYESVVKYTVLRFKLAKDGSEASLSSPLIFIGNNVFNFGSPDILSGRDSFVSGKLQLSLVEHMGRWKMALLLIKSMLFDVKHQPGLKTIMLESIKIDAKESEIWVSLDGEVRKLKTPLNYMIYPRSLRVIVPNTKR